MKNEKMQMLIEHIYNVAKKNNPYPVNDPEDSSISHKHDGFNEGYALGYTHGTTDGIKIGNVPKETIKRITDATTKALDKSVITTNLISRILNLSYDFDQERDVDQWSFEARCEYIQQHLND